MKKIILLAAAVLLVSGCSLKLGSQPGIQSSSTAPTSTSDQKNVQAQNTATDSIKQVSGSHYVNTELGFSLDLPTVWGDKYSIRPFYNPGEVIISANDNAGNQEVIYILNSLDKLGFNSSSLNFLKPLVVINNKNIYILPVENGTGSSADDLYQTIRSIKILNDTETQNAELQKNIEPYITNVKEFLQKSLEQARSKARDAKRIADARSIQSVVEVYSNDNHKYPDSVNDLKKYLPQIPENPTPGGIPYQYVKSSDGKLYRIMFSVDNDSAQYKAGLVSCFYGSSDNRKLDLCNFDKVVAQDKDGDDVLDDYEINVYHTNPNKLDTDGDGYADGLEIKTNHDPLKK